MLQVGKHPFSTHTIPTTMVASVLLLAAFQMPTKSPAQAQSLRSCATCEIEIDHLVTLGNDSQTPLVCDPHAHVARDSRGQFYVAPACKNGELLVFSPDGSFHSYVRVHPVADTDPPIIRRVWSLPGDQLYVVSGQGQHTVLDDQQNIRHTWRRFPLPFDLVPLTHNTTVQQIVIDSSPTTIGLPLHVVDHRGNIVNSFGSSTRYYRRDQSHRLFRMLGKAGHAEVWTAPLEGYRVELWAVDGRLKRAFDRELPKGTKPGLRPPWVHDLVQDSHGFLWITLSLPIDGEDPGSGGGPSEHFDTVFEVLDSATGRLVATHRSQRAFSRWLGEDNMTYTFSTQEEHDGLTIDVWQLRLDPRQ